MRLGENTIAHMETMRKKLLKKYQVYYRSKEYIFIMAQYEEESLEDYLNRFLYNLHKPKHSPFNLNFICTILLKEIRNEYIGVVCSMESRNISYLLFDQIFELW